MGVMWRLSRIGLLSRVQTKPLRTGRFLEFHDRSTLHGHIAKSTLYEARAPASPGRAIVIGAAVADRFVIALEASRRHSPVSARHGHQ